MEKKPEAKVAKIIGLIHPDFYPGKWSIADYSTQEDPIRNHPN